MRYIHNFAFSHFWFNNCLFTHISAPNWYIAKWTQPCIWILKQLAVISIVFLVTQTSKHYQSLDYNLLRVLVSICWSHFSCPMINVEFNLVGGCACCRLHIASTYLGWASSLFNFVSSMVHTLLHQKKICWPLKCGWWYSCIVILLLYYTTILIIIMFNNIEQLHKNVVSFPLGPYGSPLGGPVV